MTLTAIFTGGFPLLSTFLIRQTRFNHIINNPSTISLSHSFKASNFRFRSYVADDDNPENYEASQSKDAHHKQLNLIPDELPPGGDIGNSFLVILVVALGAAAVITAYSIGFKGATLGSFLGLQGSSSSAIPVGFNFKAFGYSLVIPERAPGWVYFWLLMAAGFGLFISEEALNIWVGITLARMLSLDGTWQSFAESFSRNSPYIISTVLWVYCGVCISDMIPFYIGKFFRQSGATGDVCTKLGIGEEKVSNITRVVRKYGNLSGVVERFSLGVRNPTAFLAGALGISPECFFAGVCGGGVVTLAIQLALGVLLRERPVFALATVATVVGIWTIFPYAMAALTALYFYLKRRYST
ncbi:hypothetical protein ACFE04_031160 [Oxalis oulophora]